VIAVVLAIEMKSLLIGESAAPGIRRQIVDSIEAAPQVRRLIHLRTLHLGPDELLVGAKVELEPALDFRAVAEAIDAVEQCIRDRVPAARVIYLEPDIERTAPE
jgi:divalent metal cation (Fe/Co/Zn/Cd) transporter